MSPSYREPSKKKPAPEKGDSRSAWSEMSIFAALVLMTLLMGLLVYGAIQGIGPAAERAEMRANR